MEGHVSPYMAGVHFTRSSTETVLFQTLEPQTDGRCITKAANTLEEQLFNYYPHLISHHGAYQIEAEETSDHACF